MTGKLIVITGPGSAGKDAIILRLLKNFPNMAKVVTSTTRAPRPGEKEGVAHYFLTRQQFEKLVAENKFLEYVEFAGHLYGTTLEALQPLFSGQDTIWRVETSRAAKIKELFTEKLPANQAQELLAKTVIIYVTVPSWEILRERLRKRGLGEEFINQRLAQDQADWARYKDKFQNIVINVPGKLDQTVEQIARLIESV